MAERAVAVRSPVSSTPAPAQRAGTTALSPRSTSSAAARQLARELLRCGKPFCTISTGKGDPLEVDPDSLSPDDRKAAFDPKRPKSCPPERWNWVWETCCAKGKHFDAAKKSCLPDATMKEQPFVIPPAPPQEKGDFPLPAESPAHA